MIDILQHNIKRYKYLLLVAFVLYCVSLFTVWYTSNFYSPAQVQNTITKHLAKQEIEFNSIVKDTLLLKQIINTTAQNTEKRNSLLEKEFGLFVATNIADQNQQIVYWNTNKAAIAKEDLQKPDGAYFVSYQNGNFEFIKKTVVLNNTQYNVLGLLPIFWKYFINNKYLNEGFASNSSFNNYYEVSDTTTVFPVKNLEKQTLFYLQKKQNNKLIGYTWVSIITRTLAVVCFLVFIHFLSLSVAKAKGSRKGFLFLVINILLLRAISYFVNFPFNFKELSLFDPSIYASNFLHPSLGDLLINTLLVVWIVLFLKIFKQNFFQKFQFQKSLLIAYLSLVVLTILTFLLSNAITGIIKDSKISFDVNNFFSLNIYSIIGFIIFSFFILVFYHVSQFLLHNVFSRKMPLFIQLLITCLTGLLLVYFQRTNGELIVKIFTLAWLFIYLIIANYRRKDINYSITRSSIFIFWAMFFTFSIAALITAQNNATELEQRKKWAEKLATQNDPNSENLLKIAITNFSSSYLSKNYYRLTQEFSNKFIKDSLVNENFSGYLNKYDTRIYTFDTNYIPLFNDDSATYTDLKIIIENNAVATSIENLFTYNNASQKQSYIYEMPIKNDSVFNGYLFVTVKPKRYKSEALYPELFKQVQDLSTDFNTNYAYAIYSNEVLIDHYNDYSFPSKLNKQNKIFSKFETKKNDNYNELWYYSTNAKTIVIAKKQTAFLEVFTLFAYLFCMFLLVVATYLWVKFLVQTKLSFAVYGKVFQFNIRTQIHATIIFISVFSFIIIGVATISFFIYRFNLTNKERLSKSIQVMANEIEEKVKSTRAQLAFDDVLTINDIGYVTNIEKTVTEISEVHNIDVNFYGINGNLIASTQPYIFNKQLLSNLMHPNAYDDLKNNKKIRVIQTEQIADFDYISIYVPVNDEYGETYAYLNIPYFNSRSELNQEISSFLATLINLNTFIFLLAGAIAYFASARITSSFKIISEKMKDINLSKHNEEIIWKRNDEIGVLVTEYNKMVHKLDESANALAKSEREGAWREMARQVAHEIKNPLTPMKLSIQYLQKSIDNNSTNIKELTNRVAATLIEQIEQLSKIAGDFSQFANIGNAKPETFDVSEIIASLIQLYSTREDAKIEWIKANGNYKIYADKIQISRLFANLFLNAIEAAAEKGIALLTIHQFQKNDMAVISITDNGVGIDEEMKHKIFTPNFTTKTSGTGLGLAICKGIVEKANGNIAFETEKDKGTKFIVQLPLDDVV